MKTKNEAFIPKKNEPRGTYILQALDEHFRNGDAYTTDDEAIHICMQAARGISYRQLSTGKLVFERSRLYLAKTKRYHWICIDDFCFDQNVQNQQNSET